MSDRAWVLFLHTPEGDDVTLFTTKELAVESITGFVQYWWYSEMPEEIPDDDENAVIAYFDHVEDERYFINEQAILEDPADYGSVSST